MSHEAHLQRDYALLGARIEDTTATDNGHATAGEAAGQIPDKPPRHSAQGSGTRVETGTNTASEPANQPARTTPSRGRGHLDYVPSEQAAAQDLYLWIDRITTGEQLALAVSIR